MVKWNVCQYMGTESSHANARTAALTTETRRNCTSSKNDKGFSTLDITYKQLLHKLKHNYNNTRSLRLYFILPFMLKGPSIQQDCGLWAMGMAAASMYI